MTGPELTRGGFSQNPTTAPATGLIVEGEPPDDADIDAVVVHGLHRAAAARRWQEGSDETTSIRQSFEGWTGTKIRLMTYNYQPTSLTPRRIHHEASSLLKALQGLRAGKESATGDSEDTERSECEEPEEGDPDKEASNLDKEAGDPDKKASRPIIFLAQDVGGLIVKAALTRARSLYEPFSEIAASVRGLIFVACPHRHDGPRPLEDQLLGLLQGHVPTHLSISALAQDLSRTIEEINGDFFRAKSILSATLVNVFSEAEGLSDRVFDRYTVTTETPFEILVPSGAAHTELLESLLSGDKPASSLLKDAAEKHWSNPKPHEPGTLSGLQALFSLASPVFPLRCPSDAAIAGLKKDMDEFSSASDTRILHLRAKTASDASLLMRCLVRHCNTAPTSVVFNFEFRRGDVRFDNIRSMAATLLAQLFFDEIYSNHDGVQIRVNIAENEYRGWTTEDLLTIWRERRYTKSLGEVVYILGGLDHCEGESAGQFLRWLEFIATQTDNPVKVIITSTTGVDGHVKEALSSCPDGAYRVFDLSPGVISDLGGSSGTDLGGSSGTDSHLAFLLQQQPRYDALERKLSLLMAKVFTDDGVLQVVVGWLKHTSLSLDMIEAAFDRVHQVSLEAVLDVILGLIPEDRRIWSRRVLSFACAAERPLGVAEMYTVSWIARTLPDDPSIATPRLAVVNMAYLKDEHRGILDWLGGLLTIRDGEVHVSHPSIRGALQPQNASHILRQHKDILDVCMAHLGLLHNVSLRDNPPDQRDWNNGSFGNTGVFDSLPYAMEHWSRHYLILSAPRGSLCSTNKVRKQASELLKKRSFLEHWAVTQQAGSRPFAPLSEETSSPSPLSVAAQLGLKDIVQESLPGLDRDRGAGLVAAARGGHLDTVKLLLQSTEEYCGPDWVSLVEAAREAGECGHNGILDILTRELSQRPSNKPPPSSLLFRAVFLGLEGVVETLLDLGADANSKLESDHNRTPLHVAAMNQNRVAMTQNRVAVLDVLVRRGGQVTAELAETGYHPLHIASNNGYVECAKALLDANPSESEVEAGPNSNIPLVLAAEEGNFRVVEVLLEHGQRRGRTPEDTAAGYGEPLLMAAHLGYRRTVDLLLGYGADPNRTRIQSLSGLQCAVLGRHVDICRLLLQNEMEKADANDAGDVAAPLLLAADVGDGAIVALLLEHGALVDITDPVSHRTALHMAAVHGHDEIIRVLLRNGAGIETCDVDSFTPLFLAALNGHAEAVNILASAGADVDTTSGWKGWGALHAAFDEPDVVRALLKRGADINKACDDGTTLYLALDRNQPETARILLENGAKLDMDGEEKEPLLATAAQAGSTEGVRALLEAGADVNKINGSMIAIWKAMEYRGAEMLELLLEYSPNPSLRESNTFLNFIGRDTPVRSVERLVRAGADPNREDEYGHTALCAAVRSSNIDAARYLLGLKSVRRHGIKGHTSNITGFLHHAVYRSTVDMVGLLIEAGEDVSASSDVDGGIIGMACCHKDDEDDTKKLATLRYLIRDAKADVNVRAGLLGYAVNIAAASCGLGVIRLLLEEGAELDVEDSLGRTPVHLACQNDLPVLQALSAPDEAFKKRDRLGRVALHFAAVSGNVTLVREVLLMSRRVGVDVDEPDVHGWTALMWAARTCDVWHIKRARPSEDGREAVVRFLLVEGADRSVSGKVEGGKWTSAEVAVFHGAGKGLVSLLSPSSVQCGSADGARRRVGVLNKLAFCSGCLMTMCGYYYRCETSSVTELCFKCYQSREELGLGLEWVRRGGEKEEESEEDAAVDSPDIDGDGDAAFEVEDEEYIEEIIIEEEEEEEEKGEGEEGV